MTWSSLSSFGVVAFCLPWLVHRNIFIFFYFFFFFSISGISLQHYTTFHIFFIISSSPFSLPSYLFIPSILPVALSRFFHPFPLLIFSFPSLLAFLSPQSLPYFSFTFSHLFAMWFPTCKVLSPQVLEHPLVYTSLCKQAPPAAQPASANARTPKDLGGNWLPAGARWGLALPWKLKQGRVILPKWAG